ncbi:putative retrotransposon hot spot (RHS) protein [Trypanosoma cruzi]|nr:putative retrotransposon hot spot (RHS) protein [Trypanosoma cruzi]
MPPKQNRVQGGNVETQASAVPQGDRQRRARQDFEGERDQPAATHIRAESQQPKWTMSSSVEDILLEGSTNRNNMKLNDFLRSNLGEEWVVDPNENVAMEAFLLRPTMFIQNKGLLRTITALPSYRELERELKRELDERKILLGAIYKLLHEGVYSLEQWRDYEGKDTVTPVARRKLNAALSQVLTEERRKAEERASRRQKLELTVTTTIEDVLFRGRVRVMDIQLNDFLVMELDGRGILRANRNVLLKEFVKDSTRYICCAFLLLEIKASDRYKRMERAVRDEMDMEEDVNKLYENDVDNLLNWSLAAEEVKANVHNLTKHFLDAAFIELMSSMTMSAPMKLEGCYESVYNARWHHVVEVPDDNGMYVREGEPPQSWKYKKVDDTLEKDDGVEEPGALRLRLMVLTSDRGWPYSWKEEDSTHDCHVNCEVERAWRIVRNDLTEWFSPHRETYFTPKQRLLIGTPGIGKSVNAGSYFLYQLLHYDAEQLPMVAYVIGSQSFLFDKTTKTVSTYRDNPRIEDVVNIFFPWG